MIQIILLDNLSGQIKGLLPENILKEIFNNCSYEILGSNFSPAYQMGSWDGFKHLFSSKTQKFPLGLFSLVTEILKKHTIPYSVKDNRVKPLYTPRDVKIKGISLRPYQLEAIDKCLKAHRGIVQIATGGGKSFIILALAMALRDLKINIYVHRTTLLRQLEETFAKAGIKVGIIGDNEKKFSNINICSFQSVLRKTKVSETIRRFTRENLHHLGAAEVMLVDEVHHLGAEMFYAIHKLSTKAYFRLGFSATPHREDNCDLLIQAATGKKIIKLGASELIQQGYLIPPKIFFLKVPAYPGLPKDYRKVYNKAIIENDLRNELIAESAKLLVDKNMTCLIAVKEVKHGLRILEELKKVLPHNLIKFIQGSGTSGKEKMQVLDDLNRRKLKIVIATTVFGEGVNVPTLSALILAKASKSALDTLQLCGRVLRPSGKKKKVIIIDLADQTTPYLRGHTFKRHKILKAESEFIVKDISSLADLQFELEDESV